MNPMRYLGNIKTIIRNFRGQFMKERLIMKDKKIRVVIENPEAIEKAQKKFTETLL